MHVDRKIILVSFLITSTCVLIDQLSKEFIKNYFFEIDSAIRFFEGLNIVYVENKGVSFGIFAEYNITFFLGILSILISGYIIFLILKSKDRIERNSLSLILGGAIGNGLDRIVYGHVVDFIDFYYKNFHWPAFNFADSFITIGAIIFFVRILKNN